MWKGLSESVRNIHPQTFLLLMSGQILSYSLSVWLHIRDNHNAQPLYRTGCFQMALHSMARSPLLGSMICRLPTISQASWSKIENQLKLAVGKRALIGLHNWKVQGSQAPGSACSQITPLSHPSLPSSLSVLQLDWTSPRSFNET